MAARWLATILGMLAALGLATEISGGCAVGSGTALDDSASGSGSGSSGGIDAGTGSGSSGGSGSGSSSGSGGGSSSGSSGGTDSGASSGGDSGPGDDAGDSGDAAPDSDTGPDSDAGPVDSGPIVGFGATCPTGAIFTEPFASDPVASGIFASLIGPYTYNAASQTLSLGTGSPNTQLWIGPRPSWTNYTVSVPVRIDTSGGNGGINFRMESTPASPANNAGQMYYAGIATNQVLLGIENGNWSELSGPSASFVVGTFYTLQVTVNGSALSVSVDGTAYVTNASDATYIYGSFGLRTYASGMTYGPIAVTCN